MKKICKTIMCLLFVFTMAGTMIIPMSANAATNVTRTSGRKSYQTLYAVPEGGWSTISFEAELVEKYNYSASKKKNIFNRHEKICLWKTAYATTKPSLTISNIIHMNSSDKAIHTFKSYTKQATMYGGEWDGCHDYYSTNEVAYSVNTKNYAMLSFYTSCDGGLYAGGTEGSNYHSIKINLR